MIGVGYHKYEDTIKQNLKTNPKDFWVIKKLIYKYNDILKEIHLNYINTIQDQVICGIFSILIKPHHANYLPQIPKEF